MSDMTVDKVLSVAQAEIGTVESPANSNCVKYNTDYYGRVVSGSNYKWCAVFVWWVFRRANASELYYGGKKTASCATLMSYYNKSGRLVRSGYKPGDIVFFNFSGGTRATHVGIVESVKSNGNLVTIEGNTGTSNQTNGGAVMRRERELENVLGAGRPVYSDTSVEVEEGKTVTITLKQLEKGDKGAQVKTLQQLLEAKGYSCGKSGADGDFGSNTRTAVRNYQRENGLVADGIVGANTWGKLLGVN
jgi:hypothetical protein